MDSWLKISDTERKENIRNIIIEETGLNNFNDNSIINSIFTILYKIVNIIYENLNSLLKQTNILSSTDFFLDMHAKLVGLTRFEALKAKRYFIGHSYSSGIVKSGTFINVTNTDLRFKVTSDTPFNPNSDFQIPVEAEFEGTKYNISSGFNLKSGKVINGLDSISIPSEPEYLIQAGTDSETDDSLRLRVLNRWVIASDEAPPSKYISVSKSVSGVDDVKIVRIPRGSGSIDIIINVIDGEDELTVQQNVINAVNEVIGVARDISVIIAVNQLLDLTVTFSSIDNSENEVREVIEDYFRDTKINESKKIASLYSYVYNHTSLNLQSVIIEPNEDFIVETNRVLKLNNLTITKV